MLEAGSLVLAVVLEQAEAETFTYWLLFQYITGNFGWFQPIFTR